MKKVLLALSMIIAITHNSFLYTQTPWQKTKVIFTSKPAKIIYGVGGVLLVLFGIVQAGRYLPIVVGKKYASLLDKEFKIDLPTIYKFFPSLENKLEPIPYKNSDVVGVSVKKEFQNTPEVMKAFKTLKYAYWSVERYNDTQEGNVRFEATKTGVAGPHLTLTKK